MIKRVITADGSDTLFVPELNDHYHSVHGAVQESSHIFIRNGLDVCNADPLSIFEVGFGTGLNALLTAVRCSSGIREVIYTAIEKFPLDNNILNSLNHHQFAGEKGMEIFKIIHSAPWNISTEIFKNFYLEKLESDITREQVQGNYDLIYFDAFGPDKQPEMWTREIFEGISSVTNKNGIFVTYSAKGEVKRNLKACGFDIILLPGPPGKRQMIRAVKI